MSMTETELQVIQRVVRLTSPAKTTTIKSPGRFLLPQDDHSGDQGLVMRIDSKPKSPMTTSSSSSSSSKGQSVPICAQNSKAFARVALWSASLMNSVRYPFSSNLNKISEYIGEQASRLLPFFLYLSLLTLVLQASALIAILASSQWSIGFIFLLVCVSILCYAFTYSLCATPRKFSTSKVPSSTTTPISLTPSSSASELNLYY